MKDKADNKKFYITTPIYYASGDLHIGHCCTSLYADCVARFKRLEGYDVCFLTGADEHGQKVEEKANAQGLTAQQFVDALDINYKKLWSVLGISYDKYIRTTDKVHVEVVQKIYEKLYEQGDIYKGKYEGWYCTPCESFFTEAQLVDGKCPDCHREVHLMEEESYFFKLSKYQKRLEEYYEQNPNFITLDSTRNEMLNSFIRPGLQDLCVSRTTFSWGVPLTFDKKHVSYVWIDALANYLSALGYQTEDDRLFKEFWPADLHFMAKEIVRFHVIIWPILLMALNLPLPKKCHAHGWITASGGQKMSKSLGNGIDPFVLSERYSADALRYYIYSEGPIMRDSVYSTEGFLNAINNDLCNNLGNLLSRTTAMIVQNFGDEFTLQFDDRKDIDNALIEHVLNLPSVLRGHMEKLEINHAIHAIMQVADKANKYIEDATPWNFKEDKQRISTILSVLHFSLQAIAISLKAFLPQTASRIAADLGFDIENLHLDEINENILSSKIKYNVQKNVPLFPRLKIQEELNYLNDVK